MVPSARTSAQAQVRGQARHALPSYASRARSACTLHMSVRACALLRPTGLGRLCPWLVRRLNLSASRATDARQGPVKRSWGRSPRLMTSARSRRDLRVPLIRPYAVGIQATQTTRNARGTTFPVVARHDPRAIALLDPLDGGEMGEYFQSPPARGAVPRPSSRRHASVALTD